MTAATLTDQFCVQTAAESKALGAAEAAVRAAHGSVALSLRPIFSNSTRSASDVTLPRTDSPAQQQQQHPPMHASSVQFLSLATTHRSLGTATTPVRTPSTQSMELMPLEGMRPRTARAARIARSFSSRSSLHSYHSMDGQRPKAHPRRLLSGLSRLQHVSMVTSTPDMASVQERAAEGTSGGVTVPLAGAQPPHSSHALLCAAQALTGCLHTVFGC